MPAYAPVGRREVNEYLRYLEERFGIPRERLLAFRFIKRGRDLWIFTGEPEVAAAVGGVEVVGIKALKVSPKGLIKPTTDFLRIVGKYATKNVAVLDSEEELTKFMTGGIIERRFDVERGFVVVKYGGDVLGCGLYDGERLISQIPKAKRIDERWLFREG